MSAMEAEEAFVRMARQRGLALALAQAPEDVRIAWDVAQASRRLLPDRVPPTLEPWRPDTTAEPVQAAP